jgi:hypothetical protein
MVTELSPDIALLQEVSALPAKVLDRYDHVRRSATGKTGRPQKFGTVILVRGSVEEEVQLRTELGWVNDELARFRGNLVAHLVKLRHGLRMRVMSVYCPAWPIDRSRLQGIDVESIKLQSNPDVWVTELLWASLSTQDPTGGPAWVVGGDLNSSETFDYMWGDGPRGNRELLDRMQELGFVECLRCAQGGLVPTFRNPRGGKVIH